MEILPKLDVFPSKEFSLYFLFYALMLTFQITKPIVISHCYQRVPFHQEVFEFLIPLGLFLNNRKKFLKIKNEMNFS